MKDRLKSSVLKGTSNVVFRAVGLSFQQRFKPVETAYSKWSTKTFSRVGFKHLSSVVEHFQIFRL